MPTRRTLLVIIIFLANVVLFSSSLFAGTTVTVLSPGGGSSNGSPVFYEAYATSSCSKGISAMRIYTASGVSAYTTSGAHIETFVSLKPGSYNTVVQAWDNCGGVGKTTVPINVHSFMAVTVFMPNSPVGNIPNHIAASAQSPSCAAGINAMRIYTASGVAPYTVHANHLNAFVNVLPGTYDFTVQAWDKCGKVIKFQFTQTVGGAPDGYLYAVSQSTANVSEFQINNGVLVNPNGSGAPPQFPAAGSPNFIAVDPGGWFAYVLSKNGIYAYQISQSNGALVPVSGSPFSNGGTGPSDIAIDPNGDFVLASYQTSNTVAIYQIDRSSGALTKKSTVTGSGGLSAVNTDFSGQYVYAVDNIPNAVHVFGYKINFDSGALSPVPGSPYTVGNSVQPNAQNGFALAAVSNYLYVGTLTTPRGQAFGYSVNFSSGALTPIHTSSAWLIDGVAPYPQELLVDNQGRYLWAPGNCPCATPQDWFTEYDIISGGDLGNRNTILNGSLFTGAMVEDASGGYVFTAGDDENNCSSSGCPGLVTSYRVASNGNLTKLSGPLTVGQHATVFGIGVSRKNGD